MREYSDPDLCMLYSIWSEDTYAAGWYSPSESSVLSFRRWLHEEWEPSSANPLDGSKQAMVRMFREQEARAALAALPEPAP